MTTEAKAENSWEPWELVMQRYSGIGGDTRRTFLHPAILRTVEDMLAVGGVRPQNARVLDYGCGSGELAADLARVSGEVVGFDPAPTARKLTAERLAPPHRIIETATPAELGESFDVIVCSLVLQTLVTRGEALGLLRLLRGALRPSGRLVLGGTHPCFNFCALSQISYGQVDAAVDIEVSPGLVVRDYHRPLASLLTLLAEAGLHLHRAEEVHDTVEYYTLRQEAPRRFAGEFPMFLVLTCGRAEP